MAHTDGAAAWSSAPSGAAAAAQQREQQLQEQGQGQRQRSGATAYMVESVMEVEGSDDGDGLPEELPSDMQVGLGRFGASLPAASCHVCARGVLTQGH